MDQIEKACSLLYPNKCCHEVIALHQLESECVKTIVTKTLGYGIIFGSTLVKLPQIIKLLQAKSGSGVSLISVLLELIALTFTSSYSLASNFPLSAWGEALFLMVMTSLVAYLILQYDKSVKQANLFLVSYVAVVYLLMSGLVPIRVLWALQVVNLPLIILGKLIQATVNYRNGHTGHLSAITVTMICAGSLTRIFTSIRETGDAIIILSYSLSSIINVVLVGQIFLYWNRTNLFIQRNLSKKKK